jgi:adenylate cyclase class IV
MPANVEIKAILHNRKVAEAIAAQFSDRVPATIRQEDIFFRCDGARLKLRILAFLENFRIEENQLVAVAYIDLLVSHRQRTASTAS